MQYLRGGQLLLHAQGPSSESSQNGGSHYCTHIKFYWNEVVCHQTYAVHITAFT